MKQSLNLPKFLPLSHLTTPLCILMTITINPIPLPHQKLQQFFRSLPISTLILSILPLYHYDKLWGSIDKLEHAT